MKRRHFLQGSLGSLALAGLPLYWFNRWDYLTIHHSAGASGDLALLRRVHRQRQAGDPVNEVPYHFLVGNGKGIETGAVVPSERWSLRLWGAHVSARNPDRNFRSIGICLIGNFQNAEPSADQYDATIALCRDLMRRFDIAAERVTLHGETPGEATLCPGSCFPGRSSSRTSEGPDDVLPAFGLRPPCGRGRQAAEAQPGELAEPDAAQNRDHPDHL